MASDIFTSENAQILLNNKFVYFFGDSNIRAIYKDLLWLIEDGRLIPDDRLKRKNEESHANDIRVSNGRVHNGCDYDERREYNCSCIIKFQFITRLFQPGFVNTIKNLSIHPDVIVINSCVWDLTRYGSNDSVEKFKLHLSETFKLIRSALPTTRVIWMATLPPAFKSKGGFLTKDIEFMRNMLPWHISYANKYVANVARSFSVDYLDIHYYFRFLLNYHTYDGIHWDSTAVRYVTNLLLTHICLTWGRTLPGVVPLDNQFLTYSTVLKTERDYQTVIPLQNISNNGPLRRKKRNNSRRRSYRRRQQNVNASNNIFNIDYNSIFAKVSSNYRML